MGQRVVASAVLSRVAETDHLIALDRIGRQQPQIHYEITRLKLLANQLWPGRFSIFMAGSRALALRSDDKELLTNDRVQSDVDLWLVVSGEPETASIERIFGERLSYLSRYEMVAMPWVAPLPFSIKLIGLATARRAFSLQNQTPSVLRMSSLVSRKPIDWFYGFKGAYEHSTREQPVDEGYAWDWESEIFRNQDLVFTDLLSFVTLGGFLVDNLELTALRIGLLSDLVSEVSRRESIGIGHSGQLFSYLSAKFPVAFNKFI